MVVRNAKLGTEDEDGMTRMLLAACLSPLDVVQDLAARDAHYNAENQDGMTPMAEAT